MALLAEKVEELNQVAGDGCGRVVAGSQGSQHVLSTPDAVKLTVYANGMQLHKMPVKPFDEAGTKAVLNDILDGEWWCRRLGALRRTALHRTVP